MTTTLETNRSTRAPRDGGTPVATIIELDRAVVLRVAGDAYIAGLEQLQLAIAQVVARRTRLAVLDLGRLAFISSLAMGQLVRLSRDLRRWNGRVHLADCPPAIREVLDVARLTDIFEFHATVEEALATFPAI
jgi:anti-anti-sigma factor